MTHEAGTTVTLQVRGRPRIAGPARQSPGPGGGRRRPRSGWRRHAHRSQYRGDHHRGVPRSGRSTPGALEQPLLGRGSGRAAGSATACGRRGGTPCAGERSRPGRGAVGKRVVPAGVAATRTRPQLRVAFGLLIASGLAQPAGRGCGTGGRRVRIAAAPATER